MALGSDARRLTLVVLVAFLLLVAQACGDPASTPGEGRDPPGDDGQREGGQRDGGQRDGGRGDEGGPGNPPPGGRGADATAPGSDGGSGSRGEATEPSPVANPVLQPVPTCLVDSLTRVAGNVPALDIESGSTYLAIDGQADDWASRPVGVADPAGDNDAGYADLRAGRAFLNRDALYVLVDFDPGNEPVGNLQGYIHTPAQRFYFGWEPGSDNTPWIADATDPDNWIDLGGSRHSQSALGDAIELRFDLRDMDGVSRVGRVSIEALGGTCCEWPDWQTRDALNIDGIPVVAASDPAWRTAEHGSAAQAGFQLAAPDTRAISVDFDAARRRAVVTGGPGSVPGDAQVLVGTIEMNDYVSVKAGLLGGFEADVAAAPGTHVLVKQDVTGRYVFPESERERFGENVIAPGVLLRLPVEPSSDGIAFGAGARLCCDAVSWAIEGVAESLAAMPGGDLRLRGTVTLHTDPAVRPKQTRLSFDMGLLFDAGGRQVGRAGTFVSPFLTSTGLPIERALEDQPLGRLNLGELDMGQWQTSANGWTATFDGSIRIPADARDGVYELVAGGMWDLGDSNLELSGMRPLDIVMRNGHGRWATLGNLTVGADDTPNRLSTVLLADELSEASRGIVAREDEGLFDVHLRTITRHDPVLPRLDFYGEPWAYRLEPYAVMLDAVDRALPNAPAVPLDLSDSALQISVTRPDDVIDVLGPAPITAYAVKSPSTLWGDTLGGGGGELRELPQLQGPCDTFAYRFPSDGDYVIEALGFVRGVDGRRYDVCGTYDLTVANTLDVETSLMPTTPFEVGDSLAPTVTVVPAMAVDVSYTVTIVGPDGATTTETFTGRSNAYGYWDGGGATFIFAHHGEYRVDFEARGVDSGGDLWVGRMRFGSVVATPDAPLVAHGRRGSDGLDEIPPPWLFVSDLAYGDGAIAPHMHFPYFTGDVLWGQDNPSEDRFAGEAVVMHSSVQLLDAGNPLLVRAREQTELFGYWDGPEQVDTVQIGQMPLRLVADQALHPNQWVYAGGHPDEIALWSYAYRSAERPGVRVREGIMGDDVDGSYWRFGDAYGAQSGNGPEGDLPDDIKFLYGAAVVRDPLAGEGVYAIYGSGWVHARTDDPLGARIMPPYRGAAGGPDGGALLNVHGLDFDILFVPMGVRPGSVLDVGDTVRMAGPIMPTLPSLVEYTVTRPDGSTRSLGGRANAVGYFYDPADDFVADQPGTWRVSLTVTHDGQSSAGPVEPPFPTGGPLTPDGRSFTFVVADPATLPLAVETDVAEYGPEDWWQWGLIPTATFEAALPPGFTLDSARVTVSMPGIVLADGAAEVIDGKLRWVLDAQALNEVVDSFDVYPNFADTVTVTFHAVGTLSGQLTRAVGTTTTHGARGPVAPAAAP